MFFRQFQEPDGEDRRAPLALSITVAAAFTVASFFAAANWKSITVALTPRSTIGFPQEIAKQP